MTEDLNERQAINIMILVDKNLNVPLMSKIINPEFILIKKVLLNKQFSDFSHIKILMNLFWHTLSP